MPRGGKREGAGGKPSWNYGKTKVIRIPEVMAEKILEIARFLDSLKSFDAVILSNIEPVTESKSIDLSGIAVRAFPNGPGIYLSDLVKAGYEIKPEALALSVKRRMNQDKSSLLKQKIEKSIHNLSLKDNNH